MSVITVRDEYFNRDARDPEFCVTPAGVGERDFLTVRRINISTTPETLATTAINPFSYSIASDLVTKVTDRY